MSILNLPAVARLKTASPISVALAATLIGGAVILSVINAYGGDPSGLVGFGINDSPTLGFANEQLGEVSVRPASGHDGKFFFVQANDPLLIEPKVHAALLDRPSYRSQRMLYPLIAGLGGRLPPQAILWGLIAANLCAIFLGAVSLAAFSVRSGMTAWLGLAFALNPGVIHELTIDGAGVLAFALICAVLPAVLGGRFILALLLVVLSSLTREVMLLSAIGVAIWYWTEGERRRSFLVATIPTVAVLSWAIYVRSRLPIDRVAELRELDLPFAGILKAVDEWLQQPAHLVVGIAVLVCLLVLCRQVFRGRRDLLALASIGFALLAPILSENVWAASYDISRAVAPVLTAVVVNPAMALLTRRPTPVPLETR